MLGAECWVRTGQLWAATPLNQLAACVAVEWCGAGGSHGSDLMVELLRVEFRLGRRHVGAAVLESASAAERLLQPARCLWGVELPQVPCIAARETGMCGSVSIGKSLGGDVRLWCPAGHEVVGQTSMREAGEEKAEPAQQ